MENTARYDRQLRIWGAHGQQRLERAKIIVLNASSVGTEVLKNLVLGGIGSFTVVDDAIVTDEDFGRSYFVDLESYQKPRVEVACRLLRELNDAVIATPVNASPKELIDKQPEMFKDFSLVIATQIRMPEVDKLAKICEEYEIPLIVLRAYGLFGYLKIFVKEIGVVETKPDDEVPDLRSLNAPWPELTAFANSIDFESLTDVEHSHVPYVVLLLRAGATWKNTSMDNLPVSREQKELFRTIVNDLRRTNKRTAVEEANFDEAIRAAYHFWNPYTIPASLKEIFDDSCTNVDEQSSDFWIAVSALKRFFQEEGTLPLNGALPDMTATTEFYLKLQTIYSEKAKSDVDRMERFIQETLSRLNKPQNSMDRAYIALVCKNARNLRCIRSAPAWVHRFPDIITRIRSRERFEHLSIALMFETVDIFFQIHEREPGIVPEDVNWPKDADVMMKVLRTVVNITYLEELIQSELSMIGLEICRWRACEFHSVGAVMGGIGAQEAIKLLTQQFVPHEGTLFYDAIHANTFKI